MRNDQEGKVHIAAVLLLSTLCKDSAQQSFDSFKNKRKNLRGVIKYKTNRDLDTL